MKIVHVSAECFPFAKVGGLADVVGALPKYQNHLHETACVILPMYKKPFLYNHQWEVVHKAQTNLHNWLFEYTVIQLLDNNLGYPFYLIDIHGLLDGDQVYGYSDDVERFVAFQIAVCHWLLHWSERPKVVHCHDHHTALIPFIMKHGKGFYKLNTIPTVLTIHNAQYQGNFGWDKSGLIPEWDPFKTGLLDWNGQINSLACGIKCASKVTTVSPSYMAELFQKSNGLEHLFYLESHKCTGILNGIDTDEWNPDTDTYTAHHFNASNVNTEKWEMKKIFCHENDLDPNKPLFIFIGRFVYEKAADLLTESIYQALALAQNSFNFFIIGSGDPQVENQVREISYYKSEHVKNWIGYSEKIGRSAYAAADFLLMPSRVEPCGLNQLYALRYGTIPIVRNIGGLKDTVTDIGNYGFGFTFTYDSIQDIVIAMLRANDFYYNNTHDFFQLRQYIMTIDHSWESVVNQYHHLYETINN
ncbi:MAG: glycogen/starch synthase [Limnohabitans sp.]|nr:glycogen/starch synthase [Limnohabitans sp.]